MSNEIHLLEARLVDMKKAARDKLLPQLDEELLTLLNTKQSVEQAERALGSIEMHIAELKTCSIKYIKGDTNLIKQAIVIVNDADVRTITDIKYSKSVTVHPRPVDLTFDTVTEEHMYALRFMAGIIHRTAVIYAWWWRLGAPGAPLSIILDPLQIDSKDRLTVTMLVCLGFSY
jgi:hypothetical protein